MRQIHTTKQSGEILASGRQVDGWTIAFALLVFLLGLFISGCGGNGEAETKAVANRFLGAMGRGDGGAMRGEMTNVAQRRMAEYPDFVEKIQDNKTPPEVTLARPVLEGENARVPAILQESGDTQNVVVRMRWEEARWRVYALEFAGSTDGTPLLTVDFENPEATIGSFGRGVGKAMGLFVKGFAEGLGEFARGLRQNTNRAGSGASEAQKAGEAVQENGREIAENVEKRANEIGAEMQATARAMEKFTKSAAMAGAQSTTTGSSTTTTEKREPNGTVTKTTVAREGNKTTTREETTRPDGTTVVKTTETTAQNP